MKKEVSERDRVIARGSERARKSASEGVIARNSERGASE